MSKLLYHRGWSQSQVDKYNNRLAANTAQPLFERVTHQPQQQVNNTMPQHQAPTMNVFEQMMANARQQTPLGLPNWDEAFKMQQAGGGRIDPNESAPKKPSNYAGAGVAPPPGAPVHNTEKQTPLGLPNWDHLFQK